VESWIDVHLVMALESIRPSKECYQIMKDIRNEWKGVL
jgi:hypothetical protein